LKGRAERPVELSRYRASAASIIDTQGRLEAMNAFFATTLVVDGPPRMRAVGFG